jgi:hypothetical protein
MLTLAAIAVAHAAEIDGAALLARLARPAPERTGFVEIRYSSLLAEPLVATGELEHREDGALVRHVTDPYRETTVLRGEYVTVDREGEKPRSFSLDRAPALRGLMASFGALLTGDLAMLERYFTMTVGGDEAVWWIRVDGERDRSRCFTLSEPDGDASVIVVGVEAATGLPPSLERQSLQAWCGHVGR